VDNGARHGLDMNAVAAPLTEVNPSRRRRAWHGTPCPRADIQLRCEKRSPGRETGAPTASACQDSDLSRRRAYDGDVGSREISPNPTEFDEIACGSSEGVRAMSPPRRQDQRLTLFASDHFSPTNRTESVT